MSPGRSADGRPTPVDLEARLDRARGEPGLGASLDAYLRQQAAGRPAGAPKGAALLARTLVVPQHRRGHGPSRAPEGAVLALWSADTPRMNGLLFPVVEEIGAAGRPVVLVHGPRSDADRVPPGVAHRSTYDVGGYAHSRWLAAVARRGPRAGAIVVRAVADGVLSPAMVPQVLARLGAQSRELHRARRFVAALRPSVVLADYDRSAIAIPYVLAARELGLPTVTLVHGPIGATGYTPLVADLALCWGSRHAAALVAAGAAPEAVAVTGNPRVSDAALPDRSDAAAALGVDPDAVVVTLGTNRAGSSAGRLRLAEAFCQAVTVVDGAVGLVRCHPTEDPDDYASVAARYPSVRWHRATERPLEECLAGSDVVVYRASGFGGDAVLHGRVAILLEPDGDVVSSDDEVVLGPDGPVARSAADLEAILREVVAVPDHRGRWGALVDDAAAGICASRGREAARRSAAVVLAHTADLAGPAVPARIMRCPPSAG